MRENVARRQVQVSEEARERLFEAALDRLLSEPMVGLERLLSRDQLSKKPGAPSRDTAFRAFPTTDQAIEAITTWLSSTERGGFDRVLDSLMETYRSETSGKRSRDQLIATLRHMLELNLRFQFMSPGTPAGRVIDAAVMTSSPMWEGTKPSGRHASIGARVIEIRREYYQNMTDRLAEVLSLAMSQLGRRPRRGTTNTQVVTLMHALTDGLVMRLTIDPDVIDLRTAADAVFDLAWLFTEPGGEVDARRPNVEDDAKDFDRVIDAAILLWKTKRSATCASAARRANVKNERARAWFPDDGDLTDSAIRSLIATQGLPRFDETTIADHAIHTVSGFLRFLTETAAANEALFAAALTQRPSDGSGVIEGLVESVSNVFSRLTRTREPHGTAKRLIEGAIRGDEELIGAILDAVAL